MDTTHQHEFDTVTEAMTWLNGQGYVHDFNLDTDCISYEHNSKKLYPDEFQIDFTFRFEGMTDPGDENVIYAISSLNNTTKGILMNAYGAYSDSLSEDMIRKLANRNS